MAKVFNANQSCIVKILVCTSAAVIVFVVIFFRVFVQSPLSLVEVQGDSRATEESSNVMDVLIDLGNLSSRNQDVKCESLRNVSSTSMAYHPVTVQESVPWIFAITPTYKRLTQMLDLTSLCQTLMNVKKLLWIVIEDGYVTSDPVTDLLNRCKVETVHLFARNISEWSTPAGRGVAQRNAGLSWIRQHCYEFKNNCLGSFFFMDDDNKYDLRIFDQIREVKFIGIWPVAYAGFLHFEGPMCINNSIVEWHVLFSPERNFPIDMAGFAINVQMLLQVPDALFGYKPHSRVKANGGWQETRFLENFATNRDDSRIECRGSDKEALVWHIKARISPAITNHSMKWKYDIRT